MKNSNYYSAAPKPKSLRRPKKIEIALTALLVSKDKGITQPEAYNAYGETCLHSTISAIRHTYGIKVFSLPSSKTNSFGGKPFHRYWISDSEAREQAQLLILSMGKKRGAEYVGIN